MGRIMAFDYGTRRIGIAVTDSLNIIATALGTQHPNNIITFISTYLKDHQVTTFVVGYPLQLSGADSDNAQHVRGFIRLLHKHFPHIPTHQVDERFTSIMAQQALHHMGAGKKQRQNKANTDAISATIILQFYMQLQQHNPPQ